MVDNPTKIYNDYVRANLPNSMSYDTGTDRYDINSHSFFKFKNSNWYFNYISKYGYSAFSAYAVNGFEPALVFDFKNDYFRKSATDSTFGASITHAASTNATMVDSDGLLKWRPHNLLTHSGDLTNAGWNNNRLTVTTGQNDFEGNPTAFKIAPTAVSGTHSVFKATVNSNLVNGMLTTVTIDLKADGYNFFSVATNGNRYAIINLSDGTVSLDTGSVSPTVTSLGNGWYRCSITSSLNQQEVFSVVETPQAANHGATTFTGDGTSGVLVAYPHSFRSDLGGMVNNPDTASSYVPTTSAVVYAPRRGQHVYNGSAWVNEGILHESEARTNLYLNSNQFVSPWNFIGSTATASAGTSPSGLADAWRWAGNGTSVLYQGTSMVAGDYTVSAWVKSNGAGEDKFRLYGSNNVKSGDFTATSEWVRYSFTFTSAVGSQFGGILYGTSAGNVDLLVYGFQLEAAATPSSYIPTTTATVTRAAETLIVPAANLPYPTPVETTGTELVPNGTFDTDLSGWQGYNDTPVWDNGRLKITAPTAFDGARTTLNSVPTTTGKRYRLTWDVELGTLSSVKVEVYGVLSAAGLQGSLTVSATGSYTMYFTAGASAANIYLLSGNATGSAWFDNVSIKEVSTNMSVQIDGKITYADSGSTNTALPWRWRVDNNNIIYNRFSTSGSRTGQPQFLQGSTSSGIDSVVGANNVYSAGTNVPFNLAGRYGSTFINGAHEGTLLTADTTPTSLPALSSTDLELGQLFMGTIGEFRMWSDDLGDVGITEAST